MKNSRTYLNLVSAPRLMWLTSVALLLLVGCGGDAEVAKLRKELGDSDSGTRRSAAKDLEEMGVRAAPAARELGKCLSDEDSKVRYRAVKALSKIGRPSKAAINELSDALVNDSDEQIRSYSAKTIDEFADEATPAVDALIKALSDDFHKVRYYASKTLGKIGKDAHPALAELEKLLKDKDELVRKSAESAIRRIKKKQTTSP